MAPLEDGNGNGNGQRVTPFLTKTYQLVDDHSIDEVISWNTDGTSFVVWRPAEFARDILPRFFKHSNLSSFVRQLNTYGFRKVSDRWEFTNENFRRNEKRLLREIRRRQKFSPTRAAQAADGTASSPTNSSDEQVTSSGSPPPMPSAVSGSGTTSNSNGASTLEEENHRLRLENKRLSQELTRMKKLCGNIFNLVSDFNSTNTADAKDEAGPSQILELMPASKFLESGCVEGSSTKLFGVSIRAEVGSRNVAVSDDMDLDMNSGMPEPSRGIRDSMVSLALRAAGTENEMPWDEDAENADEDS
ncbi:Heat shock transcription factor [Rhynchospora pubera]|uniref:Heat shock transcription factor n=1 Tax=Rhynchospora pubera TaxID=906938 RepID=A0AAV8GCP1_9POAL|nr:Heat shock transcription factor [Rhynchospora pubera]